MDGTEGDLFELEETENDESDSDRKDEVVWGTKLQDSVF